MSATDRIEAWYDETSDADAALWCVSLCTDGGEEKRCLSTHEDEGDAIEAGRAEAAERGLEFFRRGRHGAVRVYAD
jgi:hypothetical protein